MVSGSKILPMLLFIALLSCSSLKKFADDFKKEMDKSAEERKRQEQTQPVKGVSTTPEPMPQTSTTVSLTNKKITDKDIRDCVDKHNTARKEVGVAPLVWSNELANYAQEWADHLARQGSLAHRENNQYGENCAMATGKCTMLMGVEIWYSEKPKFKRQILTEANWSVAGHYSQMIWSTSRKFGMGIATSADGATYIVGNYDPPGNQLGYKAY